MSYNGEEEEEVKDFFDAMAEMIDEQPPVDNTKLEKKIESLSNEIHLLKSENDYQFNFYKKEFEVLQNTNQQLIREIDILFNQMEQTKKHFSEVKKISTYLIEQLKAESGSMVSDNTASELVQAIRILEKKITKENFGFLYQFSFAGYMVFITTTVFIAIAYFMGII